MFFRDRTKTPFCGILLLTIFAYSAVFTSSSYSSAQDIDPDELPPPSKEELARKAQNPISDLTSALMENNFNLGVGTSNGLQYVLNLEELYPVRIVDQFNLVQHFVLPIIAQPELVPGQGSNGGLGDIQYIAYLTSVNQTGLVFGFGPIISVPSAYPYALGSGKWSAGPAVSAVAVLGSWIGGVSFNQLWSFTTYNDRPNVSQMAVQPFINFNFPGAWYITSSPFITANWKAATGNRWTVPMGGGVGNVFRIGKQAIKGEFQLFDTIVSPQQGPEWSMRLQLQFLFPSDRENKSSLSSHESFL